jgi:phenylacetate-CoA ligase
MPRSSAFSLDQVRDNQLERLSRGIEILLRQNPFWRERLHPVRSWDDYARLPLATKQDLVADQLAHPPFGTMLTFPLEAYTRVHQTSGTSGAAPLRWLDTAESWEWWTRIWAEQVLPAAGITAGDRVFLAFSFGPFIGFWSAFAGAERLGAMVISGGAMTSEQRARAILDLAATVLCCTPTYALRLAESALAAGIDLSQSALHTTIHAGEPGASIPATRDALARAFGARPFDHTGMTELGPTGFGCPLGDGIHLIESEFVFEVVDGELVATNLGRWGMPLIRYRTGDRAELTYGCACGCPFAKVMGGLRGRVDEMFTVRGTNLFPAQVEDVVRRHPEVGEFVIEVRSERRMEEVTVVLEAADAAVADVLAVELRNALGVRLDCRAVPPGTLPKPELKAQRVRRLALSE